MPNSLIKYQVKRHDRSNDRSLRAWSAADEYLLAHCESNPINGKSVAVYHDRFGFLTCHLHNYSPIVIRSFKSQEKAILLNIREFGIKPPNFSSPLSTPDAPLEIALMKVPKSLELFHFYLDHIAKNSTPDVEVLCAFMTRHFSSRMLEIAGYYFENVEQSRAHKKARLLVLKGKKQPPVYDPISQIDYNGTQYQQYPGVFSAGRIDNGTRFLLENIKVSDDAIDILDLASGNGIIACEIHQRQPSAQIHLVDDAILAVESARLNIEGQNVHHHWSDDLSLFGDGAFDVIVTNPPFHFEYETNIWIALALFREAHRCLRPGGNLQLVANRHLNYKTHLAKLYGDVAVMAESERYEVYRCRK